MSKFNLGSKIHTFIRTAVIFVKDFLKNLFKKKAASEDTTDAQ